MNAKFGPIIGTNSNLHYNFDKGYGGNISPFNVSGEAGVGVIGNVNIDFLIEDKK